MENNENPIDSKKYEFTYDLLENKEKSEMKSDKWTKVSVKKTGEELDFKVNNKLIKSLNVNDKNIFLRPGIFYEEGTLALDNLVAFVKPDLFYTFEHNQPCRLALSDWIKSSSTKVGWDGSYYSYLTFKNEKKTPFLLSSRVFTEDFVLAVDLEIEKTPKLILGIKSSKKNAGFEKFIFTKRKMYHFYGKKKIGMVKLENFSGNNRRLTTVRISRISGLIKIYLNDDKGNQRLVYSGNSSLPEDEDYQFLLGGKTEIDIHKIYIWSNSDNI
ncbi:MAG: hypothetical protein U9O87_03090 [Verrucomicrobiota bacterium]|nr:hypothetical protein [Verrucomicrobiota bacterium]